MKIIRDEELGGIMMIPLFVEWNVRRCNVKNCKNKPNTIICNLSQKIPVSGWCELHYQKFKSNGIFRGILVFDYYDAFTAERPKDE